jgi:hypothetical protein
MDYLVPVKFPHVHCHHLVLNMASGTLPLKQYYYAETLTNFAFSFFVGKWVSADCKPISTHPLPHQDIAKWKDNVSIFLLFFTLSLYFTPVKVTPEFKATQSFNIHALLECIKY